MDFKVIIDFISLWALPFIILLVLFWALLKKIPMYEVFVEGAKEGFQVSIRIIPYLVAIIVAIGMLRASGCIDLLATLINPFLKCCNIPADILPLTIVRSLSGSGALGLFSEIATEHGGNAYVTKLAAVMVGSSETTFYVLTVYFGAIGITKFRHALAAGLLADIVGIFAAITISSLMF